MKRIYTFTLESEDYLSGRFRDDIRLIASMVYDQIYNYIGDDKIPLNINRYIMYNNIYDSRFIWPGCYGESYYKLDSDMYDDGYINYEPFIVGKKTFGMTIVDDSFDITIIQKIVQYVLCLLKLNYKITIDSFPYEAKDINDESHRDDAINKIHDRFSYDYVRRTKFVRLLKNSFNRNVNKFGACGR